MIRLAASTSKQAAAAMSSSLPPSIGTGALGNGHAPATTHAQPQEEEEKKLSFLDKYLSGWILLAAGIGLGLGQAPAIIKAIKGSSVGTTNIPIAIGLILMIFPPLAKVRWNKMRDVFADTHLVVLTLVMNWVVGPFLMYFLVRQPEGGREGGRGGRVYVRWAPALPKQAHLNLFSLNYPHIRSPPLPSLRPFLIPHDRQYASFKGTRRALALLPIASTIDSFQTAIPPPSLFPLLRRLTHSSHKSILPPSLPPLRPSPFSTTANTLPSCPVSPSWAAPGASPWSSSGSSSPRGTGNTARPLLP